MKVLKQTPFVKFFILLPLSVLFVNVLALPASSIVMQNNTVLAAEEDEEAEAAPEPEQPEAIQYKPTKAVNKCGDVATFFKFRCGGTDNTSAGSDNPIFRVLLFIVNFITALVGLAAVGGIIAGGIIYSSAGDNAEQTKKGITFVVNSLIAILLFAFMFAILNFVVPGGVFT